MGTDEEVRTALADHIAAVEAYDEGLADTFHPVDAPEDNAASGRARHELATLWKDLVRTRDHLHDLRGY